MRYVPITDMPACPLLKQKNMGIETIEFKGGHYPKLQSEGFASQYAFPFANKICKGEGLDIGCMKKEWAFPGAKPIDISFKNGLDAMHLPLTANGQLWDYIFTSHCLEHLPDWVGAINYWKTMLKEGGVLFLYLPAYTQSYWRPWNNRKHLHSLSADVIGDMLKDTGWNNIFNTGTDLNSSFYVIAEK